MLDWQKVTIPLAAGADTKADPRALEPPKLLLCDNAIFDETGGLQTRPGTAAVGLTTDAGGTLTASRSRALGVRDDELLLFNAGKAYSWSDVLSKWQDRGRFESCLVSQKTVHYTRTDQIGCDRAEYGNIIVDAWEDLTAASGVGGVHYECRDKLTGTVLTSSTAGYDASSARVRCRAVGTKLHVYYRDSNVLYVDVIDPTDVYNTAGAGPIALVSDLGAAAAEGTYDVAVYGDGSRAVVAYRSSANLVRLFTVTSAGVASAVTATGRTATLGVAIAGHATVTQFSLVRATTTGGANPDLVYHDWIKSDLSDDASVNVLINTTSANTPQVLNVATVVLTGQTSKVFWDIRGTAHPTFAMVGSRTVTSGGVLGTAQCVSRRAMLASRPVLWSDGGTERVLVMVSADSATTYASGHQQPQQVLLDTGYSVGTYVENGAGTVTSTNEGGLLARLNPGEGGGALTILVPPGTGTETAYFHLPQLELVSTNLIAGAQTYKRKLQTSVAYLGSKFAERGTRDFYFTFADSRAFRGAQAGRSFYLPGGYVACYDGRRVVEVGFWTYPEAIAPPIASGATGVLPSATHRYYRFYWEWKNNAGEIERSSYAGNIDGPSGAAEGLTFTIPTLQFTNKTNVYLAVYRAVKELAGPFYRVSGLDPAITTGSSACIQNNPDADSVTYVDSGSVTDAALVSLEEDPLADGELDSIAPPSTPVVAAGQSRLFIVDPEDRSLVRFSRLRELGDMCAFNEALLMPIPQVGGDVTALEVAEGGLLIFKETATYSAAGVGPSNVPDGLDNYAPPQRISELGCDEVRSLVRIPAGIMRRTKKGIYLLDNGGGESYVGAGVEDYYPGATAAVHMSTTHRAIWYGTTGGYALMFDYHAGQWSRWTGITGTSAVLWQNTPVFLASAGPMEPSATFTDAGTAITLDIETANLKTDGLAGYQRAGHFELVGFYMSAHSLRSRVSFDYVETHTTYATGAIQTVAKASLVDGETVTICDPLGTEYTFEVDVNGTGVTSGRTQVNVSTDTSADNVRDRLITAINSTAIAVTATSGGSGIVTLTADNPGIVGNHDIRETVADTNFAVTGMSGATQDDKTWTVSPAASGPERLRISLTRHKCSAIRLRLTTVTPTGTGEGLKLTGLTFHYGVKRGLGRLPSGQHK